MTTSELQQIADVMAGGGGPDFKDPTPKVRASFSELLASLPVDPDLAFEAWTVGGVPGVWLDNPEADGRVLLYMHGGAYVAGTPHGYRSLSANVARAARTSLFSPRYRLAPEGRYPAAVDDAVAAYEGLLAEGYGPDAVVVAGDSAGGGLAAALLVALKERGLPQPAGAWLLSPWADLTCSSETMTSKAAEDPLLDQEGLARKAAEYLGDAPADTPLASPVFADLSGLCPLMIHVGSTEILLDDAVRLARNAGAAGTSVRLVVGPQMFHDWPLFSFMLTEGRQALAEAGRFLAARLDES